MPKPENLHTQIAVIGSGAGGALTAAQLAQAGYEVLLVEEGKCLSPESCTPFSNAELETKYRNGGLCVMYGKPQITYAEARCVGGGTEINAGLYHRTPAEILQNWKRSHQVGQLDETDLKPYFKTIERDLNVRLLPKEQTPPPASLVLHRGANAMGWQSRQIPRWFKYLPQTDAEGKTSQQAVKQSMSRTYLVQFAQSGNGRLLSQTRALKIEKHKTGVLIKAVSQQNEEKQAVKIHAQTVFVCAGAIQTPALLRRSGLTKNVGNSLQVHPTIKVLARFAKPINLPDAGVPVHQVKQFSPAYGFGGSISQLPHIALHLLDYPNHAYLLRQWQNMAIYYAALTPSGTGTVRNLPGFSDPLVRYRLSNADLHCLAGALKNLCRLLFAAGAVQLFPGIKGIKPLDNPKQIVRLPDMLPAKRSSLMSVHLMASCPMGENMDICALDSFWQAAWH